jgi:hypothetical protein
VLLFCTMTRVLDALEDYCAWRGWEWERLDGTTGGQERAEAIARFNNPGGHLWCRGSCSATVAGLCLAELGGDGCQAALQ